MSQILSFIQIYATPIIVISGFLIGALLLWNGVLLSGKKSRIEEALVTRNRKYFKDAVKREISEEEDSELAFTPDKIRALEADFNTACTVHGVLVQFIPIFPLLGILGTVAGLMLEVQAGDVAAMMQSLDTALTTTFWGLVAAIALKTIEALFPSRIISEVDNMLDDFGRKLSITEMFQEYERR